MQSSIHPDACRLITYVAEDRSSTELIWNPRDAAAPTTVVFPDGRVARRVAVRAPVVRDHRPFVGHYVIVDCDEDWAFTRAEFVAATRWAAGRTDDCADQDELETRVLEHLLRDVDAHHGVAVLVTPELAMSRGWIAAA